MTTNKKPKTAPHKVNNVTMNTNQNVHTNKCITDNCHTFLYSAAHPTGTNAPQAAKPSGLVNNSDATGVVRTCLIIQVQSMPFERNPTLESDLADVLWALFEEPLGESNTAGKCMLSMDACGAKTSKCPSLDDDIIRLLARRWIVEVLSTEAAYYRVRVQPPLGLGPAAHRFFEGGCGIVNETYFKAPLIIMDRHQFYIPRNAHANKAVFDYSEGVRKTTQAMRHLFTDRLPSRPLKIKLESVEHGMDVLLDVPKL